MNSISLSSRKAKIICTIGPASNSPDLIRELVIAGMNVARLNFSHGEHTDHLKAIQDIRDISGSLKKQITILQDLQGPKIRTGKLKDKSVKLIEGEQLIITSEELLGDERRVSTTYKELPKEVKSGTILLLDDGLMNVEVMESDGIDIKCKVVRGGILKSNKGINIPDLKLSTSALTEKDKEDLEFGVKNGVDYVALSFVREGSDVVYLKDLISQHTGRKVPTIAKIEKPQALERIDEILDASDGIMIARGDLGVELNIEKVPVIQKLLIKKANQKGKLVITATQMLESMIVNPSPTRAEVSDVANAIFDHTDAVMLSGETAAGKFPVETVKVMSKIVEQAERSLSKNHSPAADTDTQQKESLSESEFLGELNPTSLFENKQDYSYFPQAISELASLASDYIKAKAIVVLTHEGNMARRISKGRPHCPIVALSPHESTRRKLGMYWGVFTSNVIDTGDRDSVTGFEDILKLVETSLVKMGFFQAGDPIVVVSGSSPLTPTDEMHMLRLYYINQNRDFDK